MATWANFERAAPDMAAEGRRLLYARGHGSALLATVRDDLPPRIHPISVGIVDGRLCAFILDSAKRVDLERDGRYALHTHQEVADVGEFSVRGHAALITDKAVRAVIGGSWYFEVDETYFLFDFSVESAILGLRGPDEWPPNYTRWSAKG